MKNLKKFEILKETQKSINGGEARICCERCTDGSCLEYTNGKNPCSYAFQCVNS